MKYEITHQTLRALRVLWNSRSKGHIYRAGLKRHIDYIRAGYPDGWSPINEAHRCKR